jgi:hypothetical protein
MNIGTDVGIDNDIGNVISIDIDIYLDTPNSKTVIDTCTINMYNFYPSIYPYIFYILLSLFGRSSCIIPNQFLFYS